MKHFAFCMDRIEFAYTLGAAAQAVRESDSGEVIEFTLGDLDLHIVLIDEILDSEDDEE